MTTGEDQIEREGRTDGDNRDDHTGIDKAAHAPLAEVALAHRYRRWLLYCLCTYATPMYLPDIAHQLTIWDRTNGDTNFTQKQLTVYDALYYDHLTALCDAALVTYRQQHDEVDVGSATVDIEPVLRDQLENELDDLLAVEAYSFETDRKLTEAEDE